jgi:hypothetical protein
VGIVPEFETALDLGVSPERLDCSQVDRLTSYWDDDIRLRRFGIEDGAGRWLDPRSVLGYSRDAPQGHRSVVATLPTGETALPDTSLTRTGVTAA